MLGSDQVGQGEEDVQLCRVLAQSPVARFAVSEEVLDDVEPSGEVLWVATGFLREVVRMA